MTGRPSLYSSAIADEICEWIADGGSLRAWCRQDGNPTFSSVYKWLELHDAFADAYTRARVLQAHNDADRMNELTEALERGDIAPDVARVMGDLLKWTAARRAPKAYGDKLALSGDADGAPLVVAWAGDTSKA